MLWFRKFHKEKKRTATRRKYTIKERVIIVAVVFVAAISLNWCNRCRSTQIVDDRKGLDVPKHVRQHADTLYIQLQEIKAFLDSAG